MRQASRRKHHYIYKITRFDGKYYIGLHSTDNLDDGYFGSGKYLWNSIRKYGKEAHTKEIIEFLPDRNSLKIREAEIVNEECVRDSLCMNLKLGGEGGWDHITDNEGRRRGGITASHAIIDFVRSDEGREQSRQKMNRLHEDGIVKFDNFKGKKHSQETRDRISKAMKLKRAN